MSLPAGLVLRPMGQLGDANQAQHHRGDGGVNGSFPHVPPPNAGEIVVWMTLGLWERGGTPRLRAHRAWKGLQPFQATLRRHFLNVRFFKQDFVARQPSNPYDTSPRLRVISIRPTYLYLLSDQAGVQETSVSI